MFSVRVLDPVLFSRTQFLHSLLCTGGHPGMGMHAGSGTAFLLCLVLSFFSIHAFSRESSSFCRILRSSNRGARREGHNEYRLRVEGDPETYQPGSTYRGEGTTVYNVDLFQVALITDINLSWSLKKRTCCPHWTVSKIPKLSSTLSITLYLLRRLLNNVLCRFFRPVIFLLQHALPVCIGFCNMH